MCTILTRLHFIGQFAHSTQSKRAMSGLARPSLAARSSQPTIHLWSHVTQSYVPNTDSHLRLPAVDTRTNRDEYEYQLYVARRGSHLCQTGLKTKTCHKKRSKMEMNRNSHANEPHGRRRSCFASKTQDKVWEATDSSTILRKTMFEYPAEAPSIDKHRKIRCKNSIKKERKVKKIKEERMDFTESH